MSTSVTSEKIGPQAFIRLKRVVGNRNWKRGKLDDVLPLFLGFQVEENGIIGATNWISITQGATTFTQDIPSSDTQNPQLLISVATKPNETDVFRRKTIKMPTCVNFWTDFHAAFTFTSATNDLSNQGLETQPTTTEIYGQFKLRNLDIPTADEYFPLYRLFSSEYQFSPLLSVICSYLPSVFLISTVSKLSTHIRKIVRKWNMSLLSLKTPIATKDVVHLCETFPCIKILKISRLLPPAGPLISEKKIDGIMKKKILEGSIISNVHLTSLDLRCDGRVFLSEENEFELPNLLPNPLKLVDIVTMLNTFQQLEIFIIRSPVDIISILSAVQEMVPLQVHKHLRIVKFLGMPVYVERKVMTFEFCVLRKLIEKCEALSHICMNVHGSPIKSGSDRGEEMLKRLQHVKRSFGRTTNEEEKKNEREKNALQLNEWSEEIEINIPIKEAIVKFFDEGEQKEDVMKIGDELIVDRFGILWEVQVFLVNEGQSFNRFEEDVDGDEVLVEKINLKNDEKEKDDGEKNYEKQRKRTKRVFSYRVSVHKPPEDEEEDKTKSEKKDQFIPIFKEVIIADIRIGTKDGQVIRRYKKQKFNDEILGFEMKRFYVLRIGSKKSFLDQINKGSISSNFELCFSYRVKEVYEKNEHYKQRLVPRKEVFRAMSTLNQRKLREQAAKRKRTTRGSFHLTLNLENKKEFNRYQSGKMIRHEEAWICGIPWEFFISCTRTKVKDKTKNENKLEDVRFGVSIGFQELVYIAELDTISKITGEKFDPKMKDGVVVQAFLSLNFGGTNVASSGNFSDSLKAVTGSLTGAGWDHFRIDRNEDYDPRDPDSVEFDPINVSILMKVDNVISISEWKRQKEQESVKKNESEIRKNIGKWTKEKRVVYKVDEYDYLSRRIDQRQVVDAFGCEFRLLYFDSRGKWGRSGVYMDCSGVGKNEIVEAQFSITTTSEKEMERLRNIYGKQNIEFFCQTSPPIPYYDNENGWGSDELEIFKYRLLNGVKRIEEEKDDDEDTTKKGFKEFFLKIKILGFYKTNESFVEALKSKYVDKMKLNVSETTRIFIKGRNVKNVIQTGVYECCGLGVFLEFYPDGYLDKDMITFLVYTCVHCYRISCEITVKMFQVRSKKERGIENEEKDKDEGRLVFEETMVHSFGTASRYLDALEFPNVCKKDLNSDWRIELTVTIVDKVQRLKSVGEDIYEEDDDEG